MGVGNIRVIDVKEGILADNDLRAEQLRERLRTQSTFLLNLMASPGAGKTSLVPQAIADQSSQSVNLLTHICGPRSDKDPELTPVLDHNRPITVTTVPSHCGDSKDGTSSRIPLVRTIFKFAPAVTENGTSMSSECVSAFSDCLQSHRRDICREERREGSGHEPV